MRQKEQEVRDAVRLTRRRALLMGGGMVVMFGALALRIRHLSIEQADEFRLLAEENSVSIRMIAPDRGLIQDRQGVIIADNVQNYRITLTRENSGDVEMALAKLARLITLSPETLDRIRKDLRRSPSFVPVTITDQLGWEDISKIALNAPALPGVTPEVGLSRAYPRDADFAHVIGYVGPVSERDLARENPPDPLLSLPDFQIGKIGVERWLERPLRGNVGTRRIEVNALGRVMRELGREESKPGASVHLTLDAGLQNFAQARLGDESAAAVVMDVRNGELLAVASSPSFDPNLFVRGISHKDYNRLLNNSRHPLTNKSVQGQYPPGSTFKLVTALAALNEGTLAPNTKVHCDGSLRVANRNFHCWKRHGHGTVDLARSLAESCDTFYYEIAQKVGIDKIAEMGNRLGLGQRHDIPMSAITSGLMPNKAWKQRRYGKEWLIGDTVNASIGQGYVLASPLQLAVMVARVATGRAVVPQLVKAINGTAPPLTEAPDMGISEDALEQTRNGMYRVINTRRGTAYRARIEDPAFTWAGKTGTSQVRNITAAERADGVTSNEDLPWERRDHALFVGFAPYDNPRYAIAVVVEHGGSGSAAAAPIARDVMLRALYGRLPPLSAYPANQRAAAKARFDSLDLHAPLPQSSDVTHA